MIRGILRRENSTYTYWSLQRGVVLKWFYGPPLQRCVALQWFHSLSRRNTFVGSTCAPLSALLVTMRGYDSINECIDVWMNEWMNEWMNQSINQSTNQWMNKWTNRSISQSINQSINQQSYGYLLAARFQLYRCRGGCGTIVPKPSKFWNFAYKISQTAIF